MHFFYAIVFSALPCFGAITQFVIEATALRRTRVGKQRKATQCHPERQTRTPRHG